MTNAKKCDTVYFTVKNCPKWVGTFESEEYGTLGYVDDFSAKHDYRKPNYFYIGDTSFKVSHVRKLADYYGLANSRA